MSEPFARLTHRPAHLRLTHPSRCAALPLVVGLSLAALTACTDSSSPETNPGGLAFYDKPHTVPVGVPYEGADPSAPEPEVAADEDCGRGRGVNSEGKCVRLNARELEFGGMVQIPAGSFLQGDIPARFDAKAGRTKPQVRNAGQPMFQATSSSYWIDGYEVPRSAYAKCVAEGGCTPARCLDGGDGSPPEIQIGEAELAGFPQTCVSHEQAATYCEWRGARLPTEAEWEYAARGPEGWMFPWGHEFRDELGLALGPVGYDPLDVSYFGLKGFGGNAIEWVAEAYDPDSNLRTYLGGEFRSEDGPLATRWNEWVTQLCGGSPCELGQRFTVKGGRSGARAGAWQLAEGQTLTEPEGGNFEGDRAVAQHRRLGFRCAADLGPDDAELTVPVPMSPLPLNRPIGGYELFLGVAESVSREEASRFCTVLATPTDPEELPEGGNGWRLPTLEEVGEVAQWFGGPGPFWTADGAAVQTFVDTETAEWELTPAEDGEALMARCIRSR